MFHNASTCQGTVVDLFTGELMIISEDQSKKYPTGLIIEKEKGVSGKVRT